MPDYSDITDADFDRILFHICEEEGGRLLSVPNVYEAVSEHFNDEVLDRFVKEKKT